MPTQTCIWGHVGTKSAPTAAMKEAEEASLMVMLRCHYGVKAQRKPVSLQGYLPSTDEVIYNPNTLQDLADIFGTDITKAFE